MRDGSELFPSNTRYLSASRGTGRDAYCATVRSILIAQQSKGQPPVMEGCISLLVDAVFTMLETSPVVVLCQIQGKESSEPASSPCSIHDLTNASSLGFSSFSWLWSWVVSSTLLGSSPHVPGRTGASLASHRRTPARPTCKLLRLTCPEP